MNDVFTFMEKLYSLIRISIHYNEFQPKFMCKTSCIQKKIFLNIKRSTGEKPAAHVITIVCSLS